MMEEWPIWWREWLTAETPMVAVLPWHYEQVADIYNHAAALLVIEERVSAS